ncbi:MAG: helix-turn-helix transcriptional regulator [Bryobacterales bacterium]|nr:helix-turn-helix transcriptional regulator [Bryobacterales bacterium]
MLGLPQDRSIRRRSERAAKLGLGQRLRDQRQSSDTTIAEVADQTKIHPLMLEALEKEDISPFPGKFFALSFLRQYATAIGFSPSETAALEKDLEALLTSLPAWRGPEQRSINTRPQGAARLAVGKLRRRGSAFRKRNGQVLAALCLTVAGSVGWWLMSENDRDVGSVAPPEVAVASEAAAQGDGDAPLLETDAVVSLPPPPDGRASEPPAPQASSVAPSWGSGRLARVLVVAAAPVWVRWKVDSGRPTSRMLQPDSPIRFQVANAAYLTTGNAANTNIQIDGVRQELDGTASVRHYRITGQGIVGIPPNSF